MKAIITSIIAATALAACATEPGTESAAAAGDRDCFFADNVSGYSVIDDRNVRLSVGASRSYVFTTNWNTRDLDWTHAIAVRSTTGRICTGNGLGVDLIGGDPRRTYTVVSITREPDDAPQRS
jgi:hypothetical protein